MAEQITLKPKFTVAYALIIAIAIILMALLAYFNFTGSELFAAEYFSLFSIGVIILAILALLIAFLRYLALTYKITEHEVILSEGLITKSVRTVPIKKIDNISVKRSIRDLLMMTGSVHIDTPGGPAAEIIMRYVDADKLDLIERTLKELMGKAPHHEEHVHPDHEEKAHEEPAEGEKPAKKPPKKKGKK